MIKKVLIANRGEIAMRIMRACDELHIDYILAYTQKEKNELPALVANGRSICIGCDGASVYCDLATIMSACELTHCDAIHPGYGFLSEDASLSKACEEMGIIFIGPSSKCLDILGNKLSTKHIAVDCQVPVVPSIEIIDGDIQALSEYLDTYKDKQWMIKSAYGGGGSGCVCVDRYSDINTIVTTLKKNMKKQYGTTQLMLEQFIPSAKHIEIQVAKDCNGKIVVFPERDGSIQRKYQKIIEESPSPIINSETRKKLTDYSTCIMKRLDYLGLATIEFLIDATNAIYFIEINPRLQVEHALTEQICDVDLVKMQFQLAAKKPLTHVNSHRKSIHAIEVRIYAEDVENGFSRVNGVIDRLHFPRGAHVRIESASMVGDRVAPHFDGLIAKIIVSGSHRLETINRLSIALNELIIQGIKTNSDCIKTIVNHNDFLTATVGAMEEYISSS